MGFLAIRKRHVPKAVQESAFWKDSVVIVTYDEAADVGIMFRHRPAIAGVQGFAFRR